VVCVGVMIFIAYTATCMCGRTSLKVLKWFPIVRDLLNSAHVFVNTISQQAMCGCTLSFSLRSLALFNSWKLLFFSRQCRLV